MILTNKAINLGYPLYIYRISSNKRRDSNKCLPLIGVTYLGIHTEISASLLNAAVIRIATMF